MELDLGASDEEILSAVEVWIDDMARGDYASAFARTKHDPYYQWTPELIESVINGYGLPEPHRSGVRFVVTSREQAKSKGRPYQQACVLDTCTGKDLTEVRSPQRKLVPDM